MPVYQDPGTKTWYVKCYYTDYSGTKRQRKKRGFKRQKDAKEWERNFLETQQRDLTMSFENFVKLYNEDMQHRLREYTFIQKQYVINSKLLPFFRKLAVSEITPATVRKWQNELTSYTDENGKPFSKTYLKTINNQLSAIMNYAVRYYSLKDNPCRAAGSIGKSHAEEMQFWTTDEFKIFLANISDKPVSRAGFLMLYYCGMRIGELLALEVCDVDLEACTVSITKSFQRIRSQDVITPPKTPKSNRTISMPEFLRDEVKSYTDHLYKPHKHDRLFPCTKSYFEHEMIRGTKNGNPKKIRLHDIRHPYVKHKLKNLSDNRSGSLSAEDKPARPVFYNLIFGLL